MIASPKKGAKRVVTDDKSIEPREGRGRKGGGQGKKGRRNPAPQRERVIGSRPAGVVAQNQPHVPFVSFAQAERDA